MSGARGARVVKLKLSGSLCMVDPWVEQLEEGLVYIRREFSPGGRKPKVVNHKLYHLQTIDSRTVGYIPGTFLQKITGRLKSLGFDIQVEDVRKFKTPPTPDLGKVNLAGLRDGQAEILAAVFGNHDGVIVAPTGLGKSWSLLQVCRAYPDLRIVVATARKSVVDTLFERAGGDSLLSVRARHVHDRRHSSPKEVVFSTLRSLAKCDPGKCDLLLVDECHGAPAECAATDIAEFQDARRFGFTATPKGRSDGSDLVIESLLGPVLFEYGYQDAVDAGSIAQIEVLVRRVHCKAVETKTKVARVRWNIWRSNYRNNLIAEDARAMAQFGQVLIMCATIDHVMHIKRKLPEFEVVFSQSGCDAERWANYKRQGYTNDPMPTNADLDARRRGFEDGSVTGCVCTGVWREGCDFPNLKALIRADGQSGSIPSTQIPGRLSRICADKDKAYLIDYYDEFQPTLKRASEDRFRTYRSKGWKITYV